MDSCHQQLLSLLVDRMLWIPPQIGVRVRAAPGDSGPFRRISGEKQPIVKARTVRCLEIINAIETTAAQGAAERHPFRHLDLRSGIDDDLVEKATLLCERRKCAGRQ